MENLRYKIFYYPDELIDWANGIDGTQYIISITQNSETGLWYIWYIE